MLRYNWKPFLSYGHKKMKNKGETLYSQGEKGKGFYYLAEGEISIRLLSEEGKERIIDYLLEGFLFGEQGISNEPYSTTAVTDTDVSIYYFSSQDFIEICRNHPEAKDIFIGSIISKVRMLTDTYAILNKPYEKQMAHFLLQLCEKHDSKVVPITQIALAQYIGTSRITVYKVFQKWMKKSLVFQRNSTIEITDIEKMKALLDEA
ncbi:Crp/Fnr family transcriptional regulator [Bacillus freudenreichii]|nr:Crp/Fnr family transcriptional regulator [Bacillus freudenreichii]